MCQYLHSDMICVTADGAKWTSAVIASLQALTEAGTTGSLPSHICIQLAQLAATYSSRSCDTASTAVSPSELAYSDRHGSSGHSGVLVPPPLQQQENTQLQLWWAMATAAACGQLGLPSQLGATMQGVLADPSTADVAFELQSPPGGIIMAHAAFIAAGCSKLYQAIQQQQQQQQHHGATGSAVHIQLGKSVTEPPFRQVLEYLHTGQVTTLVSDEDRLALRKLAQALELPQLAALAAGRRPTPGADYAVLKLAEIVPGQHLHVPGMSFMTQSDSQKLTEQLQQQQPNEGMVQGADVGQVISGLGDEAEASSGLCCLESRQHPSIHDLHGPNVAFQLPDRLPVPGSLPAHFDLLLVPRQRKQQCHFHDDPPSNVAADASFCGHSGKPPQSVAMGLEHAVTCTLCQETQDGGALVAAQQCLQALPVHRAILSATSPYFAAMLSDRWHAHSAADMPCNGTQMQAANRYLPAAHLPNEDMAVLSAFVRYCYTHELELQPCGHCVVERAPAEGSTVSDCCQHCWNARTAVRLYVAAEAWMVPMLQHKCLAFLMAQLPALPSECQNVVQADMAALCAWDLAQQLSIAFDRV